MEGRVLVNDLLAQVGSLSGNTFALNEAGVCELLFEELELVISVPQESEEIYLYASIGSIPTKDKEALFIKLLANNFLRQETKGSFFGVDEDSSKIMLICTHGINALDFPTFEQFLQNFIDTSLQWRTRLSSPETQTKNSAEVRSDDLIKNLKYRI